MGFRQISKKPVFTGFSGLQPFIGVREKIA
jgi:hypothetical protein